MLKYILSTPTNGTWSGPMGTLKSVHVKQCKIEEWSKARCMAAMWDELKSISCKSYQKPLCHGTLFPLLIL